MERGFAMFKISRLNMLTAALLAIGMSTAAVATDVPSSGLGQSWPNATDVSANPHWHVYVFVKDGVRYVQVNDTNGGVHGAVAAAGGEVLVLPIGSDAQNVTTSTTASTASSGETVYSDSSLTINAAVQPTGAVQLRVVTDCHDPVECSTNIAPRNP